MINEEDRKKIRAFEQILKKGLYCSGAEVTNIYNEVFKTNLRPTNCGSCLRQRVQQLIDKLNLEERQEAKKMEEPITTPSEENKATDKPKNNDTKPKRIGRLKKN